MDKYYWSFYQDAELWHDSGTSVEDCIKQAKEMNDGGYETVYIGEAIPFVPSEHLNVDVLLDDLEEQAYEFAGEAADGWTSYEYIKKEEYCELIEAIGAFVDDWLKKYGRYPTFSQIKNVTEYDLCVEPADSPDEDDRDSGLVGGVIMDNATTPMQPKPLVDVTCKLGTKGCFADGRCHALGNCENKIITNADRIRAMSDEELAEWMAECNAYGEHGEANQWLPWLQQPAEKVPDNA